ncbi:MAG: serine hydrolase domain-containing protein [Gammaproteobacteria bacterium]|nr:beta-lactamase family protein [Pseudomonadales bacterium]MCP5345273.1 beta-lactamase family protein [Pseudomonadales bacterium]
MNNTIVRLFSAAVLALLFSGWVQAEELRQVDPDRVGMSADRLARLDGILESYIKEDRIAGQVVMVLRHGGIVFADANGWRDKAAGAPMTQDTIFRIASQTKAIVSTGIMILNERGLLDIADPLSRYFPEWEDLQVAVADGEGGYTLEPARQPITLRHLLTHTSGVSYGSGPAQELWEQAGFQGWYFANKNESIGESIARMGSLPIDAQPGESWIYGYNTDILGAVIEKASGKDLWTFLRTEILEPLDMHDTHFYLPREKANRLAVVYRPGPNGKVEAIPERDGMESQGLYVQGSGPNRSYSGGAGFLSTARDYSRFLQMMLNGGELGGVRILSPKTVELMTTSHLGDIPFRPGQGFGLGFSIVEDLGTRGTVGSEGEFGWGGAYHSSYWVDPEEDLVVVYLTQIIPATGLDDYARLRNGIYQAIVD